MIANPTYDAVPFEIYPRIARHAALRESGPLARILQGHRGQGAELAMALRYHHLVDLMLATLDASGGRDEVDIALLEAIKRIQWPHPTVASLLETFGEMQRALNAAGIEVVLLKGLYFANRLYGSYHRRPQFDLDVLVRARHCRKAARVLRRLGYVRQTYDLHSRTFLRGFSRVDMHGWLRRAPAYSVDENAVWPDVRLVRLDQQDVPTLSDEFNLVLLGLSGFEDLGQGMTKIKQLLDLFLYLRQVDASIDWTRFFDRRAIERTDGIIANVFALVLALFEAQGELPRVEAALNARRHLLHDATRARALALVSAPRKHPANLTWFGQIYPGNFWHYLAWFWWAGFPENLRQLRSGRVRTTLGSARRRDR